MKKLSSFFGNVSHFIRTLTMVRLSVLLSVFFSIVCLVSVATGGTWVAATSGLIAFFCMIWYCISIEDTLKAYGRPQFW